MSQSGRSGFGVGIGTNRSVSRSRSREIQGASLGMTGLTRAASGERRKSVISVSTKLKNRLKFMFESGVGGTEKNDDNERERDSDGDDSNTTSSTVIDSAAAAAIRDETEEE